MHVCHVLSSIPCCCISRARVAGGREGAFLFFVPLCGRPLPAGRVRAGAMAPKEQERREPRRWRPTEEQPRFWLQRTADRLEDRAEAQPHPRAAAGGPSVAMASATRLARQAAGLERASGSASASSAAGGEDAAPAAAVMGSQRQYYRSGEGLLPTTFEPQRHTHFVCGRPVQAHVSTCIQTVSLSPCCVARAHMCGR